MTLQSFHRLERILRAFDELSCRDVPKVICRKIREEGQAHIRRRCPMTDDGHRIFLKVVWRQPVIFGTDERLEECPGFSGKLLKESDLLGRKRRGTRGEWPADPTCPQRREEPEGQQGCGLNQRARPCERKVDCHRGRNGRADPHGSAYRDDVRPAIALTVVERIPLQKPFVGKPHSNGGSSNRIETEKRFVGNTRERKCCLPKAAAGRTRRCEEMLAQGNFVRPPKHVQDGC